eukprot:7233110-Pyramimonas_sp.AAC.1
MDTIRAQCADSGSRKRVVCVDGIGHASRTSLPISSIRAWSPVRNFDGTAVRSSAQSHRSKGLTFFVIDRHRGVGRCKYAQGGTPHAVPNSFEGLRCRRRRARCPEPDRAPYC